MNSTLHQAVQTVRRSGGLFPEFPRAILAVRGPDRVRFLHNVMSHDIKGLTPGQARPACLLDRHGKILFTALVHARPEELLLEMVPEELGKARQALEQYRISDQVEWLDITGGHRIIALHGPAVPTLLQGMWPEYPLPSADLHHTPGPENSGIRWIIRRDLLRLPGFSLWASVASWPSLHSALVSRGNPLGILQADPAILEVLRMEAGVPWPGRELCETVILNELDSEEFVSFTKGCFVGQEIVSRIRFRGHPPRLLTGFLLDGKEPAPAGSLVQAAGSGQEIGVVTSSCFSPTLNRPIALGFLQYGRTESEYSVLTPQGTRRATRTPLPFV